MKPRLLPLSLTLAIVAVVDSSRADIALEDKFPVQDEQTQIRVVDENGSPVEGANVEVTYRPGSSVTRTDPVGQSGSDGEIAWVPQQAGIATITATWLDAEQEEVTSSATVSVKFRAPPVDGIVIMIVAGLLLIVGSIVRITKLLRTPQPN